MIKPIWLRRHIERCVMHKDIPGIRNYFPGGRNKTSPLIGREQENNKDNAIQFEKRDSKGMP